MWLVASKAIELKGKTVQKRLQKCYMLRITLCKNSWVRSGGPDPKRYKEER